MDFSKHKRALGSDTAAVKRLLPAQYYHSGLLLLLPCHAPSTVVPCSFSMPVGIVPIELLRFLPLR
jgi:hypothetical protein